VRTKHLLVTIFLLSTVTTLGSWIPQFLPGLLPLAILGLAILGFSSAGLTIHGILLLTLIAVNYDKANEAENRKRCINLCLWGILLFLLAALPLLAITTNGPAKDEAATNTDFSGQNSPEQKLEKR